MKAENDNNNIIGSDREPSNHDVDDDDDDDDLVVVVNAAELETERIEPSTDFGYEQHHAGNDYDDHNGRALATDYGVATLKRRSRRINVTASALNYDIGCDPGKMLLYFPPCQRQKWGDAQVLPRVDWGDLFFDLLYVAATYNVSNIMVLEPSRWGLLYALGTFLPIMTIWMQDTVYSARFSLDDDLYHRAMHVVLLVILAAAVQHIRPMSVLEDPAHHISMFVFCLCLCLEGLLSIVNNLELYLYGVGQRAVIKKMTMGSIWLHLMTMTFYGAACIVTALEFFPRQKEGYTDYSNRRSLAETKTDTIPEGYSTEEDTTTNTPIFLCLAGALFYVASSFVRIVFFYPKNGEHKKFTVPVNMDFIIHRIGEWTMLLFGESILSILIVDVDIKTREYYVTFYTSILTVTFLQLLHFKAQPQNASGHAARRDKNAGTGWNAFNFLYSSALVCLGASFTFFLEAFVTSSSSDAHRVLLSSDTADDQSDSERQLEGAANLFCGSLAIIFFCLDCMNLLHMGLHHFYQLCVNNNTEKLNVKWLVLILFHIALLVFTATISQWTTTVERLSTIGLACVVFKLILQSLGSFHQSKQKAMTEKDQFSH